MIRHIKIMRIQLNFSSNCFTSILFPQYSHSPKPLHNFYGLSLSLSLYVLALPGTTYYKGSSGTIPLAQAQEQASIYCSVLNRFLFQQIFTSPDFEPRVAGYDDLNATILRLSSSSFQQEPTSNHQLSLFWVR